MWLNRPAGANLVHLTCPGPLPINGSGQATRDLCCATAKVYFFPDLCMRKAAIWKEMPRVLPRVLKEFLPVFSTALECF